MSSAPLTRKVYRRRPVSIDPSEKRSRLSLEEEPIQIQEPTDVIIQIRHVALNYHDANIVKTGQTHRRSSKVAYRAPMLLARW